MCVMHTQVLDMCDSKLTALCHHHLAQKLASHYGNERLLPAAQFVWQSCNIDHFTTLDLDKRICLTFLDVC